MWIESLIEVQKLDSPSDSTSKRLLYNSDLGSRLEERQATKGTLEEKATNEIKDISMPTPNGEFKV